MTVEAEEIVVDEPRPASRELLATAELLVAAQALVDSLEGQLRAANARLNELQHRTVPDLMTQYGLSEMRFPDIGIIIRKRLWIDGVLPKDERRDDAISWFVENDLSNVVVSAITVEFGKTEHNMSRSLLAELRERFPDNKVSMKEDVHHMTLKSIIRERLEAGKAVPASRLGVTIGNVAKVEKMNG